MFAPEQELLGGVLHCRGLPQREFPFAKVEGQCVAQLTSPQQRRRPRGITKQRSSGGGRAST